MTHLQLERARRIPVFSFRLNISGLWKTTIGRKSVTKSQQCYHWTWLGLPVLGAVVFVSVLIWLSWWLLALWLAGVGLGVWFCKGVAIVNGRRGQGAGR